MGVIKLNLGESWSDIRIKRTKFAIVFNFLSMFLCVFFFIFFTILSLIVLSQSDGIDFLEMYSLSMFGYACLFALPMAWCVPLTYKLVKSFKSQTSLSLVFCICNLLFVSIIAGIILLIDNK